MTISLRPSRPAGPALVVTLLATLVAGCQASPTEEPGGSAILDNPDIDKEVIVIVPDFFPDGSAGDNLPYLDYVLQTAGAGQGGVESLEAVRVLEEAGFDRADIEITSDRTALRLPAESITVAIVIDGECAIGQWSSEWYSSAVQPLLGSGTCLLGDTLSLD